MTPLRSPGFNFSSESVASLDARVDLYHRLVETLKFAEGQKGRLWDPQIFLDTKVRCPAVNQRQGLSDQPWGSEWQKSQGTQHRLELRVGGEYMCSSHRMEVWGLSVRVRVYSVTGRTLVADAGS